MGIWCLPHDERRHNASLIGSDQRAQLVLDAHSLGHVLNQHATIHSVYSASIPFVKDVEKYLQTHPQEPSHLVDGFCDCCHLGSASILQQEVAAGC